jgi:hypothetical protein
MATLEDLREAYTTGTAGTAAPLINKVIDKLLLIDQRKYAPMRRALPRQTWETDIFYFNAQTALPQAQMTTENPPTTGTGSVAATNSTYTQGSFPIKHMQVNLDIPAFSQQVAQANGNLRDLELTAAGKSYSWLEEIIHYFGSATGTLNTKRPQWDGFDIQVAGVNKIDAATQLLSLQMMDNALDSVKGVAATDLGDDWFYLMSGKMQSRLNGLFINQQQYLRGVSRIFARDDFGNPNNAVSDNYLDGGVEVATYRNIPIVLSNFMGNVGSSATGGLTNTSNNTGSAGGLLASHTYYYMLEAVTRYGLMAASVEYSKSPNADGNSIIFSWTTPTPTDAFGNTIDILGYRLHRSDNTSGAESLYALIAGKDASDAAITSFTDTGLPVTPSAADTTSTWCTVAKSGANAASDGVTFPRVQSGTQVVEDIFLVPRTPEFAVVPVVNEMTMKALAQVNARSNQYAMIGDQTFALRSGAFAAKISRVRAN